MNEFYKELNEMAVALIDPSLPLLANLSNLSALIYNSLNDAGRRCNWCGFYFLDSQGNELILGPFQGRVACTRIKMGKGVCGTAAQQRQTLLVKNVHEFKGHIACDSASESEIVVPLIVGSELIGVLDLDALTIGEFIEADQLGLESIAKILTDYLQSSNLKLPKVLSY
jgi:putative methionine-R-sulfoxide reductase with GAF domain